MGTIEELGELAAFLASDKASCITAQGIVIDGGSTLLWNNDNGCIKLIRIRYKLSTFCVIIDWKWS